MKKDIDYYHTLAQKYFEGTQSKDEYDELFHFIAQSKSNQNLFRKWDDEYYQNTQADPELNREWQNFTQLLSHREKSCFTLRKVIGWNTFSKVAVAFLLGITLSSLLLFKPSSKEYIIVDNIHHYVNYGEQETFLLPDSSTITLNSGSYLIYPSAFSQFERWVFLDGEAYIEVKKDSGRPFIVKTHDFNVNVLGTTFNVYAYHYSNNSSVSLVNGKVNVDFIYTDKTIQLDPLDKVSYDRLSGEIQKEKTNIENQIRWTRGELVFENTLLIEAFDILERHFDVNIDILNRKKIIENRITAKFSAEDSLEETFRLINRLFPEIIYSIENKNIIIE